MEAAAEAAEAGGASQPEEVFVVKEDDNMLATYGWGLIIMAFLFYFFNIGDALSSLVKTTKRAVAHKETPQERRDREATMREARKKQQELFDKLSKDNVGEGAIP